MIKESDVEKIKYKTVYDYYDQPLSFTFELNNKLYYAHLIDYDAEMKIDYFWVNEVEDGSIKECEDKKLSLYDLMTGLTEDTTVYIIASRELEDNGLITRLTHQQALEKYATMLPDRDTYLEV